MLHAGESSPVEISYSQLSKLTPSINGKNGGNNLGRNGKKSVSRGADEGKNVSNGEGDGNNFEKNNGNRKNGNGERSLKMQPNSEIPTDLKAPPLLLPRKPSISGSPFENSSQHAAMENRAAPPITPAAPRAPVMPTPSPAFYDHAAGLGRNQQRRQEISAAPKSSESQPSVTSSPQTEERVSNLASKLQVMEHISSDPPPSSSNGSHWSGGSGNKSYSSPHLQKARQIHQFIDTLKNMQQVVERTTDEQQRIKKSRALKSLLSMFESIIDDRQRLDHQLRHGQRGHNVKRGIDPETEELLQSNQHLHQELHVANLQIQEMEGALQMLESEKQHHLRQIADADQQLHQNSQTIQHLQRLLQSLKEQNDNLSTEVAEAQRRWEKERERSREAELVASEAEKVRDGLMSDYGRITEEHLELERLMEDIRSQKELLEQELEYSKKERNEWQSKIEAMQTECVHKEEEMTQLRQQLDSLTSELGKHKNLVHIAEDDRQQLQTELHNAHQNSNTTTTKMIELQNRMAQLQRDFDAECRDHSLTRQHAESAREQIREGQEHLERQAEQYANQTQLMQERHQAEIAQCKAGYASQYESQFQSQKSKLEAEYALNYKQKCNEMKHRMENDMQDQTRQISQLQNEIQGMQNEIQTRLRKEQDMEQQLHHEQTQVQYYQTELQQSQSNLHEEQQIRRQMEMQLAKYCAKEEAAEEQIRKLVRGNAELKTKLNEAMARLNTRNGMVGKNSVAYPNRHYAVGGGIHDREPNRDNIGYGFDGTHDERNSGVNGKKGSSSNRASVTVPESDVDKDRNSTSLPSREGKPSLLDYLRPD